MKCKKSRKQPKSRKFRHAKVRLPKDFVWKLLSKVHEDTYEEAVRLGLQDDAAHFQSLIRHRDVRGYISACSDRWSLPTLNKLYGEDTDPQSLKKIRIIRIFSIAEKYIFSDSPFEPKSAALMKFYEYERQCSITNLDNLFTEALNDDDNSELSTYDMLFTWPVLQRAREFIGMVLGDDYCLTDLLFRSRNGPGASVGCRGSRSIPVGKYLPPYTATEPSTSLFRNLLESDERLARAHADSGLENQIVDAPLASILFVPKNAKTLRTIMVEPTGNVMLQLGVDTLVRTRLLRFGIDLSTQKKNQELAARGSIDGSLATVDLSGASDTIALIWLLLFPPKWAELLFSIRSSSGVTEDGDLFHFEKLSSMGNGFTFVIETLIFTSLIYGIVRENGQRWADVLKDISVYGDDIVIPKEYYPRLAATFKRVGFKLNGDKSFPTGPIRESCGSDYFKGEDISVFRISSKVVDHCDLMTIHNSLFSVENRLGLDMTLSRLFVMQRIPKESRSFGPPSDEISAYLFTNSQSPLKIFYSKRYHSEFCRIGIVKKVRPPLHQPLQKVFGKEVVHYLPMVDFLSVPTEKNFWRDKFPWFEKIGSFMYYRGPGARYAPLEGSKSDTWLRKEFLKALYDKKSYALRSAVVSRPFVK